MGYKLASLLKDWVRLLQVARHRSQSPAHYREFQINQATLLLEYLVDRGIYLSGLRILDLGCGYGGYSHVMSRAGAEVVSLDFRRGETNLSETLVQADALRTPFRCGSFPFVFCSSLIEHVPEPTVLMKEIARLLVPTGRAYVSFPPFYSPVGGHQFKPFHLLGEGFALRLSGQEKRDFASCYGDWGLYPLTIREARDVISEAGMQIDHESTRFFPFSLARIPCLGEFLTWHVQFITSLRCH